jgi:tartrate-resistant acid phosphatase type 5
MFRAKFSFSILILLIFTDSFLKKVHAADLNFDSPPDGYKICVIGDSGMSLPTQYLVAWAMERADCDQIRHTGDIIYPDGIESEKSLLYKTGFSMPYGGLLKKIPFFLSIGNHDYKGRPDAWLDIAASHNNIYLPAFYFSEDWGDVCFITIDSNIYTYSFGTDEMRSSQTAWLRNALENLSSNCRLSIAVAHHPYLSAGRHGNAKGNYKEFLEKELIGKVDIFLAGHDHHMSHEGSINGTNVFVSGAAGWPYKIKRVAPEGGYAGSHLGFMSITVKRNGSEVSADFVLYKVVFSTKKMHKGSVTGKGIRNSLAF